MSTVAKVHGHSASDILEDARAMYRAATGDEAVAHRLGRTYLGRLETQIGEADAALAAGESAKHSQHDGHDHVLEATNHLLLVMQEIRDSVEVAHQPPAIQAAFGRGADWKATQPQELVLSAHAIAAAIQDHPEVVRAAAIDSQHRHDLTELADAVEEAHAHHAIVMADNKDATAARARQLATIRAAAHHIRLVARLLHRREPEKLTRFVSPVAHHQVVHRAAKPA